MPPITGPEAADMEMVSPTMTESLPRDFLPNSSTPRGIESGVRIAAPAPCKILKKINCGNEVASPQLTEEIPNKNSHMINNFFLP